MTLKILSISKGTKGTVLASVRIELVVDGTGDAIIIDDARVLRNKQGQLWIAMPNFSVPPAGPGKSFEYSPAIILSTMLKRAVDDLVLPAFEKWEREQGAAL